MGGTQTCPRCKDAVVPVTATIGPNCGETLSGRLPPSLGDQPSKTWTLPILAMAAVFLFIVLVVTSLA
jgi:hypothetical protein